MRSVKKLFVKFDLNIFLKKLFLESLYFVLVEAVGAQAEERGEVKVPFLNAKSTGDSFADHPLKLRVLHWITDNKQ